LLVLFSTNGDAFFTTKTLATQGCYKQKTEQYAWRSPSLGGKYKIVLKDGISK